MVLFHGVDVVGCYLMVLLSHAVVVVVAVVTVTCPVCIVSSPFVCGCAHVRVCLCVSFLLPVCIWGMREFVGCMHVGNYATACLSLSLSVSLCVYLIVCDCV